MKKCVLVFLCCTNISVVAQQRVAQQQPQKQMYTLQDLQKVDPALRDQLIRTLRQNGQLIENQQQNNRHEDEVFADIAAALVTDMPNAIVTQDPRYIGNMVGHAVTAVIGMNNKRTISEEPEESSRKNAFRESLAHHYRKKISAGDRTIKRNQ